MADSPPPETLTWLHQSAAVDGAAYSQVLLHLLERVEALEKKYETQRLATLEWGKDVDKLMRWSDKHLKRIMALKQRPIPGTVELAAPTPQPTPPVAPVGGLVERVEDEITGQWHQNDREAARAAIREVAAWVRESEVGYNAARWLEQEADR